ncbi:hypothetical protein ACFSJU_19430 [Paradesertivirga mongoliensis]|uniref:Uncharacterized protein n=1 Tax=Paradesertivirga mongoliensis TaxID=2100740 RepID=A0ABW4ZSS8_9SPHI|nr:hypothetical protein [Pedobacter mongoliensis]
MKKILLLFVAIAGLMLQTSHAQSGQSTFGTAGALTWSYNASTKMFSYQLTVYPPSAYTPDTCSDNGGDNSAFLILWDVSTNTQVSGSFDYIYNASTFPNGTTVYSGQIYVPGDVANIDINSGAWFLDGSCEALIGGSDSFGIQ